MNKDQLLIPLALIVAGALVGGAIFFKSSTSNNPSTPDDGLPENIEIDPVTLDDHILGDPNAELLIVEYSDIECPYCAQFHQTMHKILDDYGADGKVAWVYRNFPLEQLHPDAPAKAQSAECVASLAGNEAYWNYLDALFDRNETIADLPAIAAEFGVDQAAFHECVQEERFAKKVQAQYDEAFEAEGRGTPYTILVTKDGEKYPVTGAQPYEMMSQLINTALVAE